MLWSHVFVELSDAIGADPSLTYLHLGYSVFAGRAMTERTAMLVAKARHVTTGSRLRDPEIDPVGSKPRIELLSPSFGFRYRGGPGSVADTPAVVAEPKVHAL